MNVEEFLDSLGPIGPFKPYFEYSKETDSLLIYFKGDPDYSEYLTDQIDLRKNVDTHEIIGCRVFGLSEIMKQAENND